MVARLVRDQEVVGSNPVASTKITVSPKVARLFLFSEHATGFEGGSRFEKILLHNSLIVRFNVYI